MQFFEHRFYGNGSLAKPMGSIGCVRASAWHWRFSSMQRTSALSGGGAQVLADHIAQLLEWVVGQFEVLVTMRL